MLSTEEIAKGLLAQIRNPDTNFHDEVFFEEFINTTEDLCENVIRLCDKTNIIFGKIVEGYMPEKYS